MKISTGGLRWFAVSLAVVVAVGLAGLALSAAIADDGDAHQVDPIEQIDAEIAALQALGLTVDDEKLRLLYAERERMVSVLDGTASEQPAPVESESDFVPSIGETDEGEVMCEAYPGITDATTVDLADVRCVAVPTSEGVNVFFLTPRGRALAIVADADGLFGRDIDIPRIDGFNEAKITVDASGTIVFEAGGSTTSLDANAVLSEGTASE